MKRFHSTALSACAFLGLAVGGANAALIVSVNYSGDPQYSGAFTTAANTWQSLLQGYQNGHVVARSSGSSYSVGQTVSTVHINANVSLIDGAGGILGQAGPTEIVQDALNYILTTDGEMQFDSADVAALVSGGSFNSVILHEMAHVLGFGTLWDMNGVYVSGSGEFTGASATSYWHSEFGQAGTPDVELGGGGGTANGHWNEVDGGAGLVGIHDASGNDMRNELMTGWLNSPTFISNMTIASFHDIGFTAAVPEPTSAALLGIASGAFLMRRRRV